MRFRRRFALLATSFAALLCIPAALADKPLRFPLPADPFQLPAAICGFPVDFVPLQNKEYGKLFSNGTFAVTGVLKARYTNAITGKSIDLNISGGGTIVPQADGSVILTGRGPAVVYFFPGDLGPGSPGTMLLIHGQFSERIDANGVVPGSFTVSGLVNNLCAMLN